MGNSSQNLIQNKGNNTIESSKENSSEVIPQNKPGKAEYTFGKLLGEGTFGKVYEAENNNNKYVGKIIPKDKLSDEKTKKAVEIEIDILRCMNQSENSLKFIDVFEDENYKIIIFELCDCNLEDLIKQNNGLNENLIYIILEQLNNAFMLMKEIYVINTNIKPKNIMIKYNGNSKVIPKIKNYQLSKQIDDYTSNNCKTLLYTAPEILHKKKFQQKINLR